MGPCIEWTKCKNAVGYGVTWDKDKQKTVLAHRKVAGAKEGEVVLHLCDNRGCVNPDHLRIGTQKCNMEDAVSKGRTAAGDRNGRAKLSRELAMWAVESPQSQSDIAFALGVTQPLISMIRGGHRRATDLSGN